MIDNIKNLSSSLTNLVTNWYNYRYDDPSGLSIRDGGRDMFDRGNRVCGLIFANKISTAFSGQLILVTTTWNLFVTC